MKLTLTSIAVLAAVVVLTACGTAAAETDPAAQQTTAAYLAMGTPQASIASFARSVRDARWLEACAHYAPTGRGAEQDAAACNTRMARIVPYAASLRVSITRVRVAGASARVWYRSTLGFSNGVALLSRVDGHWLITGFRPVS
jgi:hypothetical protein